MEFRLRLRRGGLKTDPPTPAKNAQTLTTFFLRPHFPASVLSALVFLGVTAALPSSGAQGNPADMVVITIDTLRADHLGCYGDLAIETPNLDALALSAARFTHAFTPVPITLPAHTALFTGSFPMATGMHDFSGNRVPASAMTLAKVLHDHPGQSSP